jgi:hypothetical protein
LGLWIWLNHVLLTIVYTPIKKIFLRAKEKYAGSMEKIAEN